MIKEQRFSKAFRHRLGFSYIEIMVLVAILGVVGAAGGRMLQTIAKVPSETDTLFQIETGLVSKMEEIRGMRFVDIFEGDYLSDSVLIGSKWYPRTVSVELANPGPGVVESFKHVTITCGGQSVAILFTEGRSPNGDSGGAPGAK